MLGPPRSAHFSARGWRRRCHTTSGLRWWSLVLRCDATTLDALLLLLVRHLNGTHVHHAGCTGAWWPRRCCHDGFARRGAREEPRADVASRLERTHRRPTSPSAASAAAAVSAAVAAVAIPTAAAPVSTAVDATVSGRTPTLATATRLSAAIPAVPRIVRGASGSVEEQVRDAPSVCQLRALPQPADPTGGATRSTAPCG